MKQIVVVKPNTLSNESKQALKDADVVLIEHENPSEIRIISQVEGFDGDDFFNSLVETIQGQGFPVKSAFAQIFLNKVQEKNNTKK